MPEIGYAMKRMFLDRERVIAAVGRAHARVMMRTGGRLRTRARRSMRRRKAPSVAPAPPSYHGVDPSLRRILFYYDPAAQSLIAGPILIRTPNNYYGPQLGSLTTPELHEFGATIRIRQRRVGRRWVSHGTPSSPGRTRIVRATYPKRPTMGTALKAEVAAGTIPAGYAGMVSNN